MTNLKKVAKALVAFGVLCGVVGASLADGSVSAAEWGQIAAAAGGVIGVYKVTNAA